MKRNNKNKQQSAFTVIELMISVAIVGIMAALFIPAFMAMSGNGGADSRAPAPAYTSPNPY